MLFVSPIICSTFYNRTLSCLEVLMGRLTPGLAGANWLSKLTNIRTCIAYLTLKNNALIHCFANNLQNVNTNISPSIEPVEQERRSYLTTYWCMTIFYVLLYIYRSIESVPLVIISNLQH